MEEEGRASEEGGKEPMGAGRRSSIAMIGQALGAAGSMLLQAVGKGSPQAEVLGAGGGAGAGGAAHSSDKPRGSVRKKRDHQSSSGRKKEAKGGPCRRVTRQPLLAPPRSTLLGVDQVCSPLCRWFATHMLLCGCAAYAVASCRLFHTTRAASILCCLPSCRESEREGYPSLHAQRIAGQSRETPTQHS